METLTDTRCSYTVAEVTVIKGNEKHWIPVRRCRNLETDIHIFCPKHVEQGNKNPFYHLSNVSKWRKLNPEIQELPLP